MRETPQKSPARPGPGTGSRPGGAPGKPGGRPGDRPGAAGPTSGAQDPDNPGNLHQLGAGDHCFFQREDGSPHAGEVKAHGHHGCTVEDAAGGRHNVHWRRVLGLKKRAVLDGAEVVERGEHGSIVRHKDGRQVYVHGQLPISDEPSRVKVADLEDKLRAGAGPRRFQELEDQARGESLAKAQLGHECEGPALCRICAAAAAQAAGADVLKSFQPATDGLDALVARMRAGTGPHLVKSLGGGAAPLPVLLVRSPGG